MNEDFVRSSALLFTSLIGLTYAGFIMYSIGNLFFGVSLQPAVSASRHIPILFYLAGGSWLIYLTRRLYRWSKNE